jgi:hypothetical protein
MDEAERQRLLQAMQTSPVASVIGGAGSAYGQPTTPSGGMPPPVTHDANVDPFDALAKSGALPKSNFIVGGPQVSPADASAAIGSMQAGATQAGPTMAMQPRPEFKVPVAPAPTLTRSGNWEGYTPEMFASLDKSAQEHAQGQLDKSYATGQAETGVQGVQGLDHYLSQILGPQGGGAYNKYASPQERLTALGLQSQAAENVGGKDERKNQMAMALKQMELASAEKIAGGQTAAAKEMAQLQYGDAADKKMNASLAKQQLAADIKNPAISREEAMARYQETLSALSQMETARRGVAAPTTSGSKSIINAAESLRSAIDPKTGALNVDALLKTLPNTSDPASMAALADSIAKNPAAKDELKKALAKRIMISQAGSSFNPASDRSLGGYSVRTVKPTGPISFLKTGVTGPKREFVDPQGGVMPYSGDEGYWLGQPSSSEKSQSASEAAKLIAIMNSLK